MPTSIAIVSKPRAVSNGRTSFDEIVPLALFSGIGLLVSVIAMLSGVQGVWI